MKPILSFPSRRILAAAVWGAGLWLAGSSLTLGQGTNFSEVVSFRKTTLGQGMSAVSFPLLNPEILRTEVIATSGNAVTLGNQSNVGASLTTGEPYYLEVYSGNLKGDRFDVDTAATRAAANGTVILNPGSPANTVPWSAVGTELDGATVVVRKHITLEQVQGFIQGPLNGNNLAADADQILFYQSSSSNFVTYYLRGDGVTWRGSTTGLTPQNKAPIPPGTGVFLKRNGAPVPMTSVGVVRKNDFAMPYQSGLQLVAPGFPFDFSPASLGAVAANGWMGTNMASGADQIQIHNPANNNFTTYYLRGDGVSWRGATTGTADQSTNKFIPGHTAFFVKRATNDLNNVLVNPVP